MRSLARRYLDDIKVHVPDLNAEVEMLSGGQRQAIAVARARWLNANIFLLDEPLAAMGAKESALIMDLVKDLSAKGVSMIVIDHNYASFRTVRPAQHRPAGKVTVVFVLPRHLLRS